MTDVIDLAQERDNRNGPDAEFRKQDDFGRPMFLYGLSYEMDGSEWAMEVWAYSQEDAENRVRAMRDSLTLFGQIYRRIPT